MSSIYERARVFFSQQTAETLPQRLARKVLVELNPVLPGRLRRSWSDRLRGRVIARQRAIFDAQLAERRTVLDRAGGIHTFRHEGRQVRMALPQAGTDFVQRRVLMEDGFFERRFLEATRRYLEPGSIILDVGANIGNHALYWALLPQVRSVFVFEPAPGTFAVLEQNIALNGLGGSIIAKNVAVGAEAGEVEIFVPKDNPCLSRLENDFSVNLDTRPALATFSVPLVALDDVSADLERIDLLKIDVEGFEETVISGASRLLDEHRPHVMVEVWPQQRTSVDRALARHGYRVTERLDENNVIYSSR